MLPRSVFASDEEYKSALRDWFAGQAMAAMLSEGEREGDLGLIPRSAYQYADAMIAAREATHD